MLLGLPASSPISTMVGTDSIKICRSYFGNMVELGNMHAPIEKIEAVKDAYRETVFYEKPFPVQIVCFIPALSELIRKHLPAFFLLHNFGTRSSKGFGSFIATEIDGIPVSNNYQETISNYFHYPFYKIASYQVYDYVKQMDDIADLYQLMKSGLNDGVEYYRAFIYEYMHDKGIGNEKAWMKRKGISPIVFRPANATNGEHTRTRQSGFAEYRYVRAMLGTGDTLRYINQLDNNGKPDRTYGNTKIHITNPDIERFASPVFFKVAGNCSFLLPYPLNSEILNQPYKFCTEKLRMTIQTPAVFDMCDFAAQFASYINSSMMQKSLIGSKRLHFRGTLSQCPGKGCAP